MNDKQEMNTSTVTQITVPKNRKELITEIRKLLKCVYGEKKLKDRGSRDILTKMNSSGDEAKNTTKQAAKKIQSNDNS